MKRRAICLIPELTTLIERFTMSKERRSSSRLRRRNSRRKRTSSTKEKEILREGRWISKEMLGMDVTTKAGVRCQDMSIPYICSH